MPRFFAFSRFLKVFLNVFTSVT